MNQITSSNLNMYIVKAHETLYPRGYQVVMRFPNNYGASLVKNEMSYGNLEIGVIHFNSQDNEDWKLVYDTPITDDVIGVYDVSEAIEILLKIKNLEAK